MTREVGNLSEIGTTEEIVVKRDGVKAIIFFKGSRGDDKSKAVAVRTDGGILSLIEG